MGLIKGAINAIADPRLFFMLAVLALVVMVWKRELVASNAVGYALLGGLAVFFIFGCITLFRQRLEYAKEMRMSGSLAKLRVDEAMKQ